MTSTDEFTEGLKRVDQARGQIWAAYFNSWTWYAGAAVLVGFGLTEDLAPQWAGVYFLVVGALGLSLALLQATRRGRAMLRLPAQPRSAVLGTGHRGTRRSRVLLAAVWVAAAALAGVAFWGMFQAAGGSAQSGPRVPNTVVFTVLALACVAVSFVGRHWARRKMAGHAGG